MQSIIPWWRDQFEWRAQEAQLNAFPSKTGSACIFIRADGKGPAPMPLLLSPSSTNEQRFKTYDCTIALVQIPVRINEIPCCSK
jgi:epoxide hydrolase-like protein